MSMSVGDITGADPKSRLASLYELLKAQQQSSEMTLEQHRQTNLHSLDRSEKNFMAAEIQAVLSDAFSTLKRSGQEIRDAGK